MMTIGGIGGLVLCIGGGVYGAKNRQRTVRNEIDRIPSKDEQGIVCYGKEVWNRYVGDVGEVPPLPTDIQEIMNAPCPFFSTQNNLVLVKATHMLVLIPQTVNGVELTLDHAADLFRSPRNNGHPTGYEHYFASIRTQYGAVAPSPSHWVLMTTSVIPNSFTLTYTARQEFLRQYPNYVMPTMREAALCLWMEKVHSNRDLLSSMASCEEACCEGEFTDTQHAMVGMCNPNGISFDRMPDSDTYDILGIAPLRRF